MSNEPKIKRHGHVAVPVMQHPAFRTSMAVQDGVERNLLFKTWGGLGDEICAEPTLRYALRQFKGCKVSLWSERPTLFKHLEFERVFDASKEKPIEEKYLMFETITPPNESNLVWLFFSHMLTHCVDFSSMCALRLQLPVADKEVHLHPSEPSEDLRKFTYESKEFIFVHPGRHWPSKTFPAAWWDSVLMGLHESGFIPVIIGADTDDNRGTVQVDPHGCVDLRNQLTVDECIWLMQRARVLITNDSAPLHMAASGDAHIGFIATCKHPDYITHWRNGQWSWRMQNLGKGGIWDVVDNCPNAAQEITVDNVDPGVLATWLPSPVEVVKWAAKRSAEYEPIRF